MKKMLQSLMAEEETNEWIKFIPRIQCKNILTYYIYTFAF